MTQNQPSRRRFLGTIGLGALVSSAGCLGDVSDVVPSDDEQRPLQLTISDAGGSLRESYVTDLSQTRPERDEAAFEAIRNGTEYTTQYGTPFGSYPEDPVYTRHDGTYYRLGSVVIDEVETTHPVLRLTEASANEETASGDAAETVSAEQLPEVDAAAVRVAQMTARARGNEGGAPWGLVRRGGYVYRSDDVVEGSELVSGDAPASVTYRERRYAVEVTQETFHESVYRATAEPVAEAPDGMEAVLRAQFVESRFDREDLSTAAIDIVEQSAASEYTEAHPYSEGYRKVLRAMHERPYLDGNVAKDAGVEEDGPTILRYNGEYYDYRLRFLTRSSSGN
ncbi:MAG: hypothetical protein ABEI27_10235 [Halobellus sp.]|uniref:hypothetical protein n=1 Tax=Halobellus sp. TaxID=1979212 RepID=UPI0035D4C508